jgi:uncharacterized protein
MKYRSFGRLAWESSILGIGVMRLPGGGKDERGAIDQAESVRMIRHGIDRGVNYVDLGLPWDMAGHEPVVAAVRAALAEGYRQRAKVALTIPAHLISSPMDLDLYLDTQLEWLGSDSVDFCLLGRLHRDNWPELQRLGILDRLEKAREDGRIGGAGFSFHDQYQVLRSIVQAYDRWVLCSLQYSYMDVNHDPGASGIRYVADGGLAVVVTEPFRGGRLTKEPPEEVRQVWARSGRERSLAEWALRFVWNNSRISVVVSDMSSMVQLDENLSVADVAEADSLSIAEEVTISNARDAFRKRQLVPCPSCRPCMPCPVGIDVPRLFEIYNDAAMYDDIETARSLCAIEQIHPGDCTGCGICEGRCAKRLPIVDRLERARSFLGVD